MATRVNLDDLMRGTDHMYKVNIFPGCEGEAPNIAGDTLHIIFRSDKCMPEDEAELWVSQIQPDNEETQKGEGFIPVTSSDSDIPEALYHYVVLWERTSRVKKEKYGIIYGRARIVAGCPGQINE